MVEHVAVDFGIAAGRLAADTTTDMDADMMLAWHRQSDGKV